VDDSIATTPQSAAAALEAVPRPCVILVGGKDKGADAAPLLDAVRARARGVVGIGTTGPALVAALRRAGGPPAVEGGGGPDLVAAVRAAVALARPGDAVLLSPGYASLDQYASFQVRGDAFAAAARTLAPA
jgi:UDP-N-acetylmuramoylalanine--D-glutamate ligase